MSLIITHMIAVESVRIFRVIHIGCVMRGKKVSSGIPVIVRSPEHCDDDDNDDDDERVQ